MRPRQPSVAGVKTLTRFLYRIVQLTAMCSSFLVASQCALGQSTGRDGAVDVPAQAPAGQTGSKSAKTKLQGVDILSDTQGVDFDPYIKEITHSVFSLWMNYIPADARSPTFAKGQTLIRFTIAQDGSLRAMHLDGSSHHDGINRSAWAAIAGIKKFPPFPKAFSGPSLELRVRFIVNEKLPNGDTAAP
jgi:TonB family protein